MMEDDRFYVSYKRSTYFVEAKDTECSDISFIRTNLRMLWLR